MVLYDLQGRISLDYLFMEDGTPIIQGAMMTEDGWPLFELTDHTVPVYALTSTLPGKALVNTILSYTVTLNCTNNADPGRELHVSIDMPPGFEVIESMSDEGEYNQDTGKFSCYLNNDGIATLNLLVDVFGTGSQTQTASLDGTDVTLTSNCDVYTTDSDGGIVFREVDLTSYPDTLANMQDGKLYTVVSYTRVSETGVTGIHDGIRNNCLSVLNVNKIDNLVHANLATGSDTVGDTTGINATSEEVVVSSVEWSQSGTRSLKITTNGSSNYEGYAPGQAYRKTAIPGKNYTGKISLGGVTGEIRVFLRFFDVSNTKISQVSSSLVTFDGTKKEIILSGVAPEGSVTVDCIPLTSGVQSIIFYSDETIIVEGSEIPEYDYMDINGNLIISGVETIGSRPTLQNNIQKQTCTFIYDSSKELYIRQHDQYKAISTSTVDRWYGLCINEGTNNTYTVSKSLLDTPTSMLDDTGATDITLDGASESNEYTFQIAVSNLTNPLSFFTGLQLTLNSFSQYQSGVEATITTTTGNSSTTKSSFISTTGQINLGGMADLWGLQNSDIEGQTLNVTLKFTNTTLNQTTFQYNNITLSLYYIEDQTGQSQGFTAKDIHSMNYQLYLLEAEIPEGPNREIKTITFPQSDGETIVSHSINSKDINIKFVVWGDTLTQAKQKLRAINQWLTNTRNTLNIPQPYTLIFDFESDIAYQVVLDEPITTTINYTSIECEASFTVESGVALTSENKITGPVGTNEGLIKVHPTIRVVCDGSNPVTVTEVETGQIVKINTGIPPGTVIIIDCNARTITSTEGTDYTTYADIETVWFNFFNDYNLTCSGGVIQSVEYQEGY